MTDSPLYTKPQNAEVSDKERLTTYEKGTFWNNYAKLGEAE